jgi:starvation-inducible DNA-binding protein
MSMVGSPQNDDYKAKTGDALQGVLTDLIDLSLLTKQLHWNLIGKNLRSIHLQLDETVIFARDQADIVAERAVAIGVNPNGQSRYVADQSRVSPVPACHLSDEKTVTVMVDNLGSMIQRTRERITATDTSDRVSQDRIIAVAQGLEEQHWMYQAESA